ncbi:MAG: hypothetical protein F6K09_11605 [Merismopedia sp. SIO2A8]|nr:hypothetical protein [Symploca sp. SIO2B6]NET49348.1 hypothetical protein [Merismopedia sp. SIO2A8]
MNYVIAVLGDRIAAEAAYSDLEKDGIPLKQMSILGQGYKTPEEYGFIDPVKKGRRQARFMAYWLVPFGFISGYAFNVSTQYMLVPEAGVMGNHLLGALFGAIAGGMGSFFIGGGLGSPDPDDLPYRDRLNEGKYLVIVKGAPNLTNRAGKLLRACEPEAVQGYVDTLRA